MKRDCGFDNIKGILIFCVVFGHLLELCCGVSWLYKMIYLFHMPVFMFVTGYFASFKWRGLVQKAWMYLLFQFLYILFERYVIGSQISFGLVTPYWILWYMFIVFFYSALVPLYRAKSYKKRIAMLSAALVLSVAAGFISRINYQYSLSRFFVFQPYFIMGLYAREQGIVKVSKKTFWFLVAGTALSLCLAFIPQITYGLLYGSVGYDNCYEAALRLLLFVVACLWIGVFLGIKERLKNRVPFVSEIGRNTLAVYLLHGFLMRLGKWGIFPIPQNILLVLLFAAAICFAFGNNVIGTVVTHLSPTMWIKSKK